MLCLSAAGGLAGAFLLTVTSDDAFDAIIPWLLLAATLLFAFAPCLVLLLAADGFGPTTSRRDRRRRLGLRRLFQRRPRHPAARGAGASWASPTSTR